MPNLRGNEVEKQTYYRYGGDLYVSVWLAMKHPD